MTSGPKISKREKVPIRAGKRKNNSSRRIAIRVTRICSVEIELLSEKYICHHSVKLNKMCFS
ncbi:MAG: hypothetical protein CMQ40_06305 [Gammaproteobacteria bacterium]|nr:hypothetical protein [Gammaproteobacteria bacterium]